MPAAPAKEGGCRGGLEDPERSQTRQALGRSRGGLTTKVHLAADGRGLPLVIVLMPGNINDSTVNVIRLTPKSAKKEAVAMLLSRLRRRLG